MNNTKFKLLSFNFLQNACHFLIISKHKLHAHCTYPALFITVEPNSIFFVTIIYSDNNWHTFSQVQVARLCTLSFGVLYYSLNCTNERENVSYVSTS
jgi:hypothetical protein